MVEPQDAALFAPEGELQSPYLRLYRDKTALHEMVNLTMRWLDGDATLENKVRDLASSVGQELAGEMRRSEGAFFNFFEQLSTALIPEKNNTNNTYEFVSVSHCPETLPPHQGGPRIWTTYPVGVGILAPGALPKILGSPDYFIAEVLRPHCIRCKELDGGDPTHPTEISFYRVMPEDVAKSVHEYERAKEQVLHLSSLLLKGDRGGRVLRSRASIEEELALMTAEKVRFKDALLLTHDDRTRAMQYVPGHPEIIESDARNKAAGSMSEKFVDIMLLFHMARRGELGPYERRSRGATFKQVDDMHGFKLIVPFHVDETYPLVHDILDVVTALGARVLPSDNEEYGLINPKHKPGMHSSVKILVVKDGELYEGQLQTPREREEDRGSHHLWKWERKEFLSYARVRGKYVDVLSEIASTVFPSRHTSHGHTLFSGYNS